MRSMQLSAWPTLILVVAGFFLGRGSVDPGLRSAHGQGAGGAVIMAAANTQNEVFCFLYDPSIQQLVSYRQRPSSGIELQAIRSCDADFNPKFEEFPRSTSATSVPKMRELVQKMKDSGDRKRPAARGR